MWSNDPTVAYHTVQCDKQLGDFEVLEYDEHDRMLTRTTMRHPRNGEPGELIRFAASGEELERRTYIDAVDDVRVRVIRGEQAGRSGKLGVTIRDEHTGAIKQRVDIAIDANRFEAIFVEPGDIEQLD